MKRILGLIALFTLSIGIFTTATWASAELDHATANGTITVNETNENQNSETSGELDADNLEILVTGQMTEWSKEGTLGSLELRTDLGAVREIRLRNTNAFPDKLGSDAKLYAVYREDIAGEVIDPNVLVRVSQEDEYQTVVLYEGTLVDFTRSNSANVIIGYDGDSRGFSFVEIIYSLAGEQDKTVTFNYQLKIEEVEEETNDPVTIVIPKASTWDDPYLYDTIPSGSYQTFTIPAVGHEGWTIDTPFVRMNSVNLAFSNPLSTENPLPESLIIEIRDDFGKVLASSQANQINSTLAVRYFIASGFSSTDLIPVNSGNEFRMYILNPTGEEISNIILQHPDYYTAGALYNPDGSMMVLDKWDDSHYADVFMSISVIPVTSQYQDPVMAVDATKSNVLSTNQELQGGTYQTFSVSSEIGEVVALDNVYFWSNHDLTVTNPGTGNYPAPNKFVVYGDNNSVVLESTSVEKVDSSCQAGYSVCQYKAVFNLDASDNILTSGKEYKLAPSNTSTSAPYISVVAESANSYTEGNLYDLKGHDLNMDMEMQIYVRAFSN